MLPSPPSRGPAWPDVWRKLDVSTTVTRLAARFAGLPYTFTAHAKDIYHESVNQEDLGRKLEDAAGVVTVSDYNLRYLRER